MKILVLSDTHGKLDKAIRVYEKLKDIDMIIHLGDHEKDADRLRRLFDIRVESVPGNMDGSYSSKDYRILETDYGKLLLTHGHMENVKYDHDKLLYKADALDCEAVLFGHTHMPAYEQVGHIYVFNPGSLTYPRDGSSGSYGIIQISKDEFRASVVYYDTVIKNPSDKKVQGGYIRNLLNYSDRF